MRSFPGSRPPHADGSGRETISAMIGSDPYAKLEELREAGHRKAKAEGVSYQLEAETKITLARLMNELAVIHARDGLSEAKLERLGRAHPQYAAHVALVAQAVEEREMALSDYYAIKSELEWDGHVAFMNNALSRLER